MEPHAILKSAVTHSTPYYQCYVQDVDFVSFSKKYYVVDFGRTAAVVCINEHNQVLMTRQYRLLLNRISTEIAGGGLDIGDTYEAAAKRELKEEANVTALELIPLCRFSPGLDIVDNFTEIFLCKKFKIDGEFQFNASEILEVDWIGIDDCLKMISSKEIQDGTTIMGIALAKDYLLNHS